MKRRNFLAGGVATAAGTLLPPSLAAAIALPELTFIARQINANTFRVMEVWLTASALYLATAYLIAILLRQVERRYASIR